MIAIDWRITRAAVDEHRHELLRIDRAEFGAVLLAAVADEVHRNAARNRGL